MAKVDRGMTGQRWHRMGCMAALCVVTAPGWALDGSVGPRSASAPPTTVLPAPTVPLAMAAPTTVATATTVAMVAPAAIAMAAPSAVAQATSRSAVDAAQAGNTTTASTAPTGTTATLTPLPVPPASAEAAPTSSPSAGWLSLRPRFSMRLPLSAQDWRTAAAATQSRFKSLSLPDIQLVELPREPSVIGPPPKRAHHAISVGMEAPKQFLRSMGLEATECATRFRLPSKLGKSQNGDTTLEVSAHLGLGCKF